MEDNPFDDPPSDEEIEPELVELQTDGFAEYVHRLDTEQNERLQEEEHEIVRLWKARNTVLSRLESTKKSISSPMEVDIHSISENQSPDLDNESILSRHTDIPKVESFRSSNSRKKFSSFSLHRKGISKHHRLLFLHVCIVVNHVQLRFRHSSIETYRIEMNQLLQFYQMTKVQVFKVFFPVLSKVLWSVSSIFFSIFNLSVFFSAMAYRKNSRSRSMFISH